MIAKSAPRIKPLDAASALLGWYDRHRRDLPWRALPGQVPDPYAVWLSEIMLQQTGVETVKGYFARFLARWPDVHALAAAPESEVLAAWAGLGYYARARNLQAAARELSQTHGGRFPREEAELRLLPGIGAYTAAAIRAIAFDAPALVIDGNIERVITRLFAISTELRRAKPEIRAALAKIAPVARPGDFAQAMMDLGAMICTPRQPACALCPLVPFCAAQRQGEAESFPVKSKKAPRPVRNAIAYVVFDGAGRILLRSRPPRGLLGGMSEVPTSDWVIAPEAALPAPPIAANWRSCPAPIVHVFTHFELRLEVKAAYLAGSCPVPPECRWVAPADLPREPLPTLMRKVIAAASAWKAQ